MKYRAKKSVLILLILPFFFSCSKSKPTNVEVVQNYYKALNQSDFDKVLSLFADSIRTEEMGYVSVMSNDDYYSWLTWDSVFHPKYKILDIHDHTDGVHVTISKKCQRTMFLNGEPTISNEVVNIKEGKIVSTEITGYVVFNLEEWNRKKEEVVSWVAIHHPELNGFIHDQTKVGGLNYLKVIALYNSRDSI